MRERFAAAPVARLATVRPGGGPHLVPCVFAVMDDVVVSAVDAKPKSSARLQRLADIAGSPQVSLLVDHYASDWSELWWARADGLATVLSPETDERAARAVAALVAKYPQYESAGPPRGPVIWVAVRRWVGWAAAG